MLRAKPCELKSKLTAKGIGRETSKMRERLPASAATLTEPPRRRAFEPGEAGEAAWCTEMGNLSGTAFTEFRSPRTSYEYDVYTWAVNEYCIRQGHGSYVEVVEAGQSATSCSSTGFLKPTYDEQGRMKVMKPEMLLAVIMDMATGSKEMPKDGHKDDRPFPSGRTPLSRRCWPGPGSLMACPAWGRGCPLVALAKTRHGVGRAKKPGRSGRVMVPPHSRANGAPAVKQRPFRLSMSDGRAERCPIRSSTRRVERAAGRMRRRGAHTRTDPVCATCPILTHGPVQIGSYQS